MKANGIYQSQICRWVFLAALLAVSAFLASPAGAETPYSLDWARQPGTSGDDYGYGVAADTAGNVFVTGYTRGTGQLNTGLEDALLNKYSASGSLLWTRQLGTSFGSDISYGVKADAAGNVFITGFTTSNLDGPYLGGADAFLTKYDASGTLAWTRQLGTHAPPGINPGYAEEGKAVAVDAAGNVYITGYTQANLAGTSAGGSDAFLAKYDTYGNTVWTRQYGTAADDRAWGVAVDPAGNVFITGDTYGDRSGPDALYSDVFLAKYNTSGNLLWTRSMGTPDVYDIGYAIASDSAGNVYISGNTGGSLGGTNAGGTDAFVSKYDGAGNVVWTRQLGTPSWDGSYGVAVDAAGSVFVSGSTFGSLEGTNSGRADMFISKYSSSGNFLWTSQLGTSTVDYNNGLAVDADGNVLISGYTEGSLGGPSAGGYWGYDTFVAKFVSPEIQGDANGDGFVGGEDLRRVMLWWGYGGTTRLQGDLNGDGLTNGPDYNLVLTNWGTGAAPEAIPEPATIGLLVLSGLAGLIRRR